MHASQAEASLRHPIHEMFQEYDRGGRPGLGESTSRISCEIPFNLEGTQDVLPYSCGTAPDSYRLRLFSPGIRTKGTSDCRYSVAASIQPGMRPVKMAWPRGAVQKKREIQATLGRLPGSTARFSGESQICDAHQNWMSFLYIGRPPGLGRALPAQFWKPVQNINKTCTSLTDHQPRTAALQRRLCGQNQLEIPLPRRLNFPRLLAKSVAFPLVHFFVTFFAPICPSFSLVRSPKNRNATPWLKMQHFRGPFRALRYTAERPPLSHRNDLPASP